MNTRLALVAASLLVVWSTAGADVAVTAVSAEELVARQAAESEVFVLDVRTPEEFVSGHVPGAVNISHEQVAERLGEIPRDREVVLYCRSGRRAMLAAEVLAANGYSRLGHLTGDMAGWAAAERPVEIPADVDRCLAALKSATGVADACAAR